MNFLILGCGMQKKIVSYFKSVFSKDGGRVITGDSNALSPALYEGDAYYLLPRVSEYKYIDEVLEICRKENISGVTSFSDAELPLLSRNAPQFAALGVTVIGSPYDVCETAINKWQMYIWLRDHGYLCARSFLDIEEFRWAVRGNSVNFPVFVKPITGSGSVSVSKAYDMESIEHLFSHNAGLMIQDYLNGQEIGADCYIDMISGKTVAIFTKKKLLMRAGETDRSLSFSDARLNRVISDFVEECGFRGQVDIDIFEMNGEYYISEVNPRFGGGYPHAFACGMNSPEYILNNLRGDTNMPAGNFTDGVTMLKYNEAFFITEDREPLNCD